MKTKLFIAFVLLIFIFSCKKEKVEVICSSSINNTYTPLSVGSYWIYQWYRVDTLGNEDPIPNWIDTVRIVKDTLIGSYQYAVQEEQYSATPNPEIIRSFFRDSLGHLINSENEVFFSSTNFTDTFRVVRNIAYNIYYLMELGSSTITNSIGTFQCLNYQGRVMPLIGNFDWSERYLNNFYAKGVGKVQESTFYFSSPQELQRRLTEYHIE